MKNGKLPKSGRSILFLTLYYKDAFWQSIIRNFILEFLKNAKTVYGIKYIIHFSKNREDNIGFTINIAKHQAKEFLKYTKQKFREYQTNTSVDLQNTKPEVNLQTRLFMALPTNCLLYGLHFFVPQFHDASSFLNHRFIWIWETSSSSLLNRFCIGDISSEDLFTVGIYISTLLILTNNSFLTYCQNNPLASVEDRNLKRDCIYKYEESRPLITDILADCQSIITGNPNDDILWLANWADDINKFIQQVSEHYNILDENIITRLYESITSVLRRQLGFTIGGNIILDYFLYMTFKKDIAELVM